MSYLEPRGCYSLKNTRSLTMAGCFDKQTCCKLLCISFLLLVAFSNLSQTLFHDPGENDLRVYEVEIGRQLITLFPFIITVSLYLVSSFMFPDAKKLEQIFQDFYTFLGLPLTCLGFINIVLHYVIRGASSNLIPEIPVASFSVIERRSSFHVTNFLAMLQLPALASLTYFSNCLIKFRPQIPILIFNSLFLGVVLDRLSRRENAFVDTIGMFSPSDMKFCYSLGFQVFLIDLIFVVLSRLALEKTLPCSTTTRSTSDQKVTSNAVPDKKCGAQKEIFEEMDSKKFIPGAVLIDI